VVDDVPANIDILADILRADYRVTFATSGLAALETAMTAQPSLILLDVMMPEMDGYEVCRRLKGDLRTTGIPVIFLTAQADTENEEFGLKLGAVDYLHKPCHPAIVRQRVRLHLQLRNQNLALENKVRERTRELEETRIEIIRRLGRAAEYRDNETGMHVMRMSQCCHRLALAAGIPTDQAEVLQLAAPMHDIGKIGIPDHILLKPGKLDEAEWAIMQSHVQIGAEIIGKHDSPLLAVARAIALTHHERWDGKGYPLGLVGEVIPIEGRIAAICDVYDALLSVRPYKVAWPAEKAIALIVEQSGQAFDPALVKLFQELLPEFARIRELYADVPADEGLTGNLVQLVYVSTATRELDEAELRRILEASQRHNVVQEVTGMLLYSQGSFMQVLEGEASAVEEAMSRIAADSRHHGIFRISEKAVKQREFGNWAMGFRSLNAKDTESWPGYTVCFERGFGEAGFAAKPGLAIELLRQFATQR
jgi:putative two-component system response regulator